MISRKWFLRLLLTLVVSLTLRTAWLVGEREWIRSEGESEVAAAFAATEATDPDWNWERLSAKRTLPEKNGALLIPQVMAKLPKEWRKDFEGNTWESERLPLQPNQPLDAEFASEIRTELAKVPEAVSLARSLKDYPSGNRTLDVKPDIVSTKMQDTSDTRTVARLLRWDTALAVEDHNATLTADNLLAMLNVSRSLGDEPFLISQLVRVATRSIAARTLDETLARCELPEARLAALQAAWALDAEEPLLLHGLRGERALHDTFFCKLADGSYTPGNSQSEGSFEAYAWWLYRGRFPRERAAYHRWVSAGVEAARLPIHEQPAAMKNLPPMLPEEMKMASLLLPAVEKVAASTWRSVAEARCVVTALACERHRMKTGAWPASLTDVMATVPLDPFDGKPLRYRVLEHSAVIYSVGKNGTDDGGKVSFRDAQAAEDLGIKLWNISERKPKITQ